MDYIGLSNLIDLIDGGVEFLVSLGTTGESAVLTNVEKQKIIAFTKNELMGEYHLLWLGGNSTSNVVAQIKSNDFSGIDAILSVSPSYNKPTQEGIYQHFKAISEACPTNIILYNVPGRTSSNMSANTTLSLANDFENIIAIKEASGDMEQIMQILKINLIILKCFQEMML